jgi:predicted dehydrogenase
MTNKATREIKLGLIGLGNWGTRLSKAVEKVSGITLGACYARTEEHRKVFAKAHNCRAATSIDTLVTDPTIDGIIIATPHSTHVDLVMQVASLGKHIMVEKPLALSQADAKKCVAAARAAGVYLQVAHYRRRLTATRKAKEWVNSGKIGRIHSIEAVFNRPLGPDPNRLWRDEEIEAPAGAMTALGIHMLDNLLYLGGPIARLACLSSVLDPATPLDDITSVLAEFQSGAHGSIMTSLRLPFFVTTAVHGDKASAWSEGDGSRFFSQVVGMAEREEHPVDVVDGVTENLSAFATSIRLNREPETNGEQAITVITALDAIQKSAKKGGVFVTL